MLVCLCTAMALCWKAKKKSPKKKHRKNPMETHTWIWRLLRWIFFSTPHSGGYRTGRTSRHHKRGEKKTKPISFLVYFDYVYCHYSSLLSHSFQHVMLMHIFWLSELHWSLCFSSRALYETVFFFGGPFVIAFIIGFQYSRSSMASERRIQTII